MSTSPRESRADEREPLLDAHDLVTALGEATAQEVLGDLAAGLGARVVAVHEAAAAGRHDDVRRACHAVRSAASQVGALRLAAAATALERSGADADRQHLAEVAAATDRAIRSWLAGPSSDPWSRG